MKNKHILTATIVTTVIVVSLMTAYAARTKQRPQCSHVHARARYTQYSPEYRAPEKCFDCASPTSQDHWNISHGPNLSAGR